MPLKFTSILDYLFPPSCLLCQKGGAFLCPSCQQKLSPLPRQVCPVCLKATPAGQTHTSCWTKNSLLGLSSAFSYKPYFRQIMAQIKYQPYLFAALKPLTSLAFSYLDSEDQFLPFQEFISTNDPVVIPIPLHKDKLKTRGFNQAEIIAEFLANHYDLALETKLLLRTKKTKSQFNLDPKNRRGNIKDAFGIDEQRLANCPDKLPAILLVDDIWTTGSTMKEATRVLRRAGFTKIWAMTLAQ